MIRKCIVIICLFGAAAGAMSWYRSFHSVLEARTDFTRGHAAALILHQGEARLLIQQPAQAGKELGLLGTLLFNNRNKTSLKRHWFIFRVIIWIRAAPGSGKIRQTFLIGPFWLVLLLTICYPAIWCIRVPLRRRRHRRLGRCVDCGYDLTGNVTGKCSECGRETYGEQNVKS